MAVDVRPRLRGPLGERGDGEDCGDVGGSPDLHSVGRQRQLRRRLQGGSVPISGWKLALNVNRSLLVPLSMVTDLLATSGAPSSSYPSIVRTSVELRRLVKAASL